MRRMRLQIRSISEIVGTRQVHRVLACIYVRTAPLTTPPSASGHRRGALTPTRSLSALLSSELLSPELPSTAGAAATPPPPHTIIGIDGCRTQCGGCAVCCEGRLAKRAGGGPTGVYQLQACAPRSSSTAHPPPLLCAPLSQERQNKQTRHQITHAGCGMGRSAASGAGDAVPECTVRRAALLCNLLLTSGLNRPHSTKYLLLQVCQELNYSTQSMTGKGPNMDASRLCTIQRTWG